MDNLYPIPVINNLGKLRAQVIFLPFTLTSGDVADPKDVKGLFQALTEGGWGGLMGPTDKWEKS